MRAVRRADRTIERGPRAPNPHPPSGATTPTVPLVARETHVPLEDGAVRLAVVADTHSEPHPRTIDLLRAERPHAILHGGDIGDLSVLAALGEVAPILAVRGNIDGTKNDLPDDLSVDLTDASGARAVRLFLTHIAVYGPKLRKDAATRARAAKADVVVCGHSHVPFLGRDRGLVVFNPGSVGPRRFRLPIVFGVIEVAAGRMGFRHVSCETGEAWVP